MRPIPYEYTPKVQNNPLPAQNNQNISMESDNFYYSEYKEKKFYQKIRFWGFMAAVGLVLGYAGYRLIKIYAFGG